MKKSWMRAGLALTAAGAMGLGMGGTAFADDPKDGPTQVTVTAGPGWMVNGADNSSVSRVEAGIMSLTPKAGGDAALAYCIDIHHPLDVTQLYQEGTWDNSNVANLDKVNWVLNNAYPTKSGADLAKAAGADASGLDEKTLDQAAYTATQTSVWSFTDDFVLNTDKATDEGDAVNGVVAAEYSYLTKNATKMPEPSNEITLDGPKKFDTSTRGGPFKVNAPGETKLDVKGAKAVDANDKEIKSVKPGEKFWLLPDDGTDSVTMTMTSDVVQQTGSVFLGTGTPAASKDVKHDQPQKLILAKAIPGQVSKNVSFELENGDTLPVTGMSLTNSALVGLGLLLAGAAAIVVLRRRKVAATWGDAK
ncbi:MAG TPA: thioester domain-containing protein [Stackebrandtia sp.]|jgi:TQXA domain-containing protein/LPXTG-motif cell wall-anchored protein|uniref:thioester domain-containing protein n=1 Tax=Stackebrandtia sp. TaxID=2023065 RepID=UPI002D29D8AD|nr:thioester domain-containing protein [Stackebrandtia sp.]HZE37715.1 thioester domain-containing protein [Stackebrandtia sp.]